MSDDLTDPPTTKVALRRLMRERRSMCDPVLGSRVAEHLLAAELIGRDRVVAGFHPLPGEIDIRPMLVALIARGDVVALPETPEPGSALTFRRWRPGAPMKAGRFGTLEPTGDRIVPSVLLVPLLAFDRRGRRLGYGGGYYDRTLVQLGPQVLAIGCAFAVQEVDRVPTETHDCVMDAVATEAGVIIVE